MKLAPISDGVFSGVPWETYQKIDRVNWSSLKHLARSPAHYRAVLTTPIEDTDAMRLGRATHLATLEPEKFAARWAVWEGGRRYGKEWDAFRKQHEGLEILKQDEHAEVLAMAEAARRDEYAGRYLRGGQAEVAVLWQHEGVDCKARLDFAADVGAIVDLKTCRDASPEAFGRSAWNLTYYGQAAFYVDGYRAATGKELPYLIVAVESAAPYVVQTYVVPERVLDRGRALYRELLEKLAACRRTNHWPGYGQGPMELPVPGWAQVPDEEEDISGLGLVVNQ